MIWFIKPRFWNSHSSLHHYWNTWRDHGFIWKKEGQKNTATEAQPPAPTEATPAETSAPAPVPTEKGGDMFR